MNKLLILIPLLCVYAIRGDDSDDVAGEDPQTHQFGVSSRNVGGGSSAGRYYGGGGYSSGSNLGFLVLLLVLLRNRSKSTTTSTTAAAETTAAATTDALLAGYTACPNGCQYRIRTGATSAANARTSCAADGAGVVLGHQMLRTGAQRRAVLEVCLGQTGEGNVMIYLEDSDGTDNTPADSATWGPTFEPYIDDPAATVTYNPDPFTSAMFGFAVDPGFNDIQFEDAAIGGRHLCEYCP